MSGVRPEIMNFFGYPKSMVYDIARRCTSSEESEEGSCMPAQKIQVRENTERTPNLVKKTQKCISDNPGISIRELAHKRSLCEDFTNYREAVG